MLLTVALIVFGIAYLAIGWYGREFLLQTNPCQMTYTTMAKIPVPVVSSIKGFKLFKHPSSNSPTASKLNPQPVLFIPGHRGNPDQVRSLSSAMHNGDEYLQFFAVDFNGQDMAIHGSNALIQAIFINDALEAILALYRAGSASTPVPSIIIVGHSVGGMTARTAITLSNHPPGCPVSDIILLSTPTRLAAYSPDASMEALYKIVNRAWVQAHFPSSGKCVLARKNDAKRRAQSNHSIVGEWGCPMCVPGIRVVSLGGGSLDILVPASLTATDTIQPRPRNITHESSLANQKTGLKAALLGLWTFMYGGGSGTVDSKAAVEPADALSSKPTSSSPTDLFPNHTYSPLLSITAEKWASDVMPYHDSSMIAMRTSQLAQVGFPVDHNAILWCKQLVSVVSKAIRKLAKTPKFVPGSVPSSSSDSKLVYELFDLAADTTKTSRPKTSHANPALDPIIDLLIPPVASFARRNESHIAWISAETFELRYLARTLPYGVLQACAVHWVSQHWVWVLVGYVAISIMAASVALRRRVTAFPVEGVQTSTGKGRGSQPVSDSIMPLDWTVLHWHVHFHIEELSLIYAGLSASSSPQSSLMSPLSLALAAIAKLTYDILYSDSYSSGLLEYNSLYRIGIDVVVAYAIALLIRVVLLVTVYGIKGVTSACMRALGAVLRATIWNVYVRKMTKRLRRKLEAYCWQWFVVLAGIGGLCYAAKDSLATLPFTTWLTSVLTVVASIAACGLILLTLIFPMNFNTESDRGGASSYEKRTEILPEDPLGEHLVTSLALLYLPFIPLAYPSTKFCLMLLFSPTDTFSAALPLFDSFGPERLNTLLSFGAVAVHMMLARRARYVRIITSLSPNHHKLIVFLQIRFPRPRSPI